MTAQSYFTVLDAIKSIEDIKASPGRNSYMKPTLSFKLTIHKATVLQYPITQEELPELNRVIANIPADNLIEAYRNIVIALIKRENHSTANFLIKALDRASLSKLRELTKALGQQHMYKGVELRKADLVSQIVLHVFGVSYIAHIKEVYRYFLTICRSLGRQ